MAVCRTTAKLLEDEVELRQQREEQMLQQVAALKKEIKVKTKKHRAELRNQRRRHVERLRSIKPSQEKLRGLVHEVSHLISNHDRTLPR